MARAAAAGQEKDLALREAMLRAVETIAVTDTTRGTFLKFSRGFAVLLLVA